MPSIVTLESGDSSVGVSLQDGASITHYRKYMGGNSVDVLRPWQPGASIDPRDTGCFPLVPFSGRITDGTFKHGVHTVRLPANMLPVPHAIHGEGWQRHWQLIDQGTQTVAMCYEHDASDTAYPWPFSYRAEQRLTLAGESLVIELTVTNTGNETMPTGLGLHPYFPRTPLSQVRARVRGMWQTDAQVMPTTHTTAATALALADGIEVATTTLDNVFSGWQGQACVLWPEHGLTLELNAGSSCEFLVIYTPPGEAYFCVEPTTHCPDAFNLSARGLSPTGHAVVAPGESQNLSLTLTLRQATGTCPGDSTKT